MNAKPAVSHEKILSLHRYFLWADLMRVHAEQIASHGDKHTETFFLYPYFSYWYGGMYVVVEGWRRLRLADLDIDTLLKSTNVSHLEKHRHGAFHYHPTYSEAKLLALASQPDAARFCQ